MTSPARLASFAGFATALGIAFGSSHAAAYGDPKPTLVAPRAALVDPNAGDDVLMSKGLHSKALQGSIAKLMTAYVASWAVKKGYVKWSDTVALTKRDTTQACTCMKTKRTPPSDPEDSCSATSATKVGEKFRLDDLVQVTLNQSTGESSDAVAQYVARKVYGLPAAKSPAESDHHMNLFIGLMNKRAKDLKLDDSTWITVHGGDTCDFGEGCDPKCTKASCHPENCAAGEFCGGGTSVHDLALLWHALTRDEPKFLALIGTRAFDLHQSNDDFYNSYRHSYSFYPGLDGDKNGGSGECPSDTGSASCHMAQATRAGHPLIAVALQSFTTLANGDRQGAGVADLTAMFRWGFAQVLRPKRRVDSETKLSDVVQDHALACNEGQCYTALRKTDDTLKLVAWNANPTTKKLDVLASSTGGPGGYASVSSLDVDTNAMGTVVAMVSGGEVKLARWWLTGGPSSGPVPNVKLTFLGDSGSKGGTGNAVRVRLASDDLAVTAVRAGDGTIRLGTWRLGNTAQDAAQWLADGTSTSAPNLGTTGEFALAVGPDPDAADRWIVVTADATESGAAALQSWRVNAKTGAITFLQKTSLGSGRNVSVASNGTGKFGVAFTTGTATTGKTRTDVWDVTHEGVFARTMSFTESEVASSTRIAALGPAANKSGIVAAKSLTTAANVYVGSTCGNNSSPSTQSSQRSAAAFVTAVRRDTGAQLAVWDAPKYWQEASASIGDFRIADSGTAWGKAKKIRLARMPSSDTSFDRYVTSQMRKDGTLLLVGWQVGQAP